VISSNIQQQRAANQPMSDSGDCAYLQRRYAGQQFKVAIVMQNRQFVAQRKSCNQAVDARTDCQRGAARR
jgi:hypothetical protein